MYADASLKRTALDPLWLHFAEMGSYGDPDELQVMVRGDGCYVEDSAGKRYLDALAGLFCANIRGPRSARPRADLRAGRRLDLPGRAGPRPDGVR